MVDVDTFLTTLYVIADDFCKASLPVESPPGPHAALACSEGLTLTLFGQWQGCGSEHGFYRYAQRHLRPAFPQLPTQEQWNRQLRYHQAALVLYVLHLVQLLAAQQGPYAALDSTGGLTHDAKRRGSGWLPGLANINGICEAQFLALGAPPVSVYAPLRCSLHPS